MSVSPPPVRSSAARVDAALWAVSVTLLAVLLAPTAGITLMLAAMTPQGRAGFLAALAIVAAVRLLRLPRAVVPWTGLAAAVAALGATHTASGWDLEGTLGDDTVTTAEQVVLALAVGGGVLALLLGLAGMVAARSWGGRAAGLVVAHVGAFAAAGYIFL